MKLRHAFLYIAVACIAVLSSNIAWAQTAIIGCTKITQPGSYVLKNNITATHAELQATWQAGYPGCIVIAANFVTINLSDYLITGPGLGLSMGIAQDTTTRIGDVVQSGSITGFYVGVGFAGTGHTIKGVNASNNDAIGIYLIGDGHRVIGNTANNNGFQCAGSSTCGGYGIYVNNCSNLILENVAIGNQGGFVSGIVPTSGTCNTRQENFPRP